MSENRLLKFEVTLEQANAVFNLLGHAPYVQSAGLIALLQAQAAPQLQAWQEEDKANESTTATE